MNLPLADAGKPAGALLRRRMSGKGGRPMEALCRIGGHVPLLGKPMAYGFG